IDGDPNIGMGPLWHDFSTGDFYGNLSGIVEGNGYTFGVFFDKDGSPNIGADYCDEGDDMGGMLQNISVWGMSDIGTVELGDCSGFNENEYSYDFEMGGSVNVFDGPGANDLDGATDFSVEFFIMFHGNPGTDQILFERLEPAGSNNDMELRWDNSYQQFELSFGTEGTHYGELFAGGMDLFDSNWHHIYIQYLSGLNRLEFFWDGALASNTWPTASSPFMPSSDYPLRFGTDLAASVDEVRIRKVSEDWGSSFGVPGDPYIPSDVDFNTIVLWHCDENEGTQLTDDGYAQNNPGIVEGTGAWDGSSPWVMGPGGNVWWEPNDPQPNTTVTIHYDVIAGTLPDGVSPVYMNIGYNGFQNAVVYEMTHDYTGDGQDWWKVDYMIPSDATDVSFEFQDAQTSPTYVDDNEGYPWVINIGGGTSPSWINISQPNASSSWTMGTGESIQWTSDSPGDYWVDIDLYKDGGYIESIHVNYQSAPNGSYWWSIPNTLNAGGNYQVRIKDIGSGLEVFSDNFEITGGGGQEGVISGQISLNEEWASAQVRMVMWFPTSDPQYDPPDMENSWGEDPPFDVYREYFRSTDIVEGGPYKIKVYFDANNNNIQEENEPGGGLDVYVPANQIANDAHIALSLAPQPTISGEITYDGNYYSNATIKIIVYEDPAVWPTYGEGVTQIVLNGPFNFGQTVTFTIDDPALGNNCCYRLYAEFDDNSNGSGTDAERWFPFPIDLSDGSVSGVEIDLGEEGNWIIEDLIAECGNSDVAEGNWDNDCYEGNVWQMGQIVDNDYGTSNGIGGNLNFVYEFSLANGLKQINHIEIINGYPNDAEDNDCNWMSGGTIELWDNSNSEWDLVANINNSNLEKTMVFEFPAYETDRIQFRIIDVGVGSGCHPEVTEVRAMFVGSTEAPNNPPIIVSGAALTTPEETPLEITLSNLTVTDSDNNYPDDFTLTVLGGDDYIVDGTIITPSLNFNGELTVPVYVDDGESENSQSNTYSLTVTVEAVNDA
ncbi:MAG: hypothetical protein H8E64_00085, partial [Candidatus Marinimicrobia bacterium]|nr:hypothetical protein [Candidatus Neomarinimicrobiota bacterium]